MWFKDICSDVAYSAGVLVHEVPSGAVAMRGCARMHGCAEESTGVDEIGCAEDWGYIRLVTDGEWPVCGQPVIISLRISPQMCTELTAAEPVFRRPVVDYTCCFSCHPGWWNTMSSGVDLPAVDQAVAAPAATDPLPGTFFGTLIRFEIGQTV